MNEEYYAEEIKKIVDSIPKEAFIKGLTRMQIKKIYNTGLEEGKAQQKKEFIEIIDFKLKFHNKEFKRYNKKSNVLKNVDLSQVEYSTNKAIQEMNICDVLKELKEQLDKSSDLNTNRLESKT